jgi:chemotaxis signal transduction protein
MSETVTLLLGRAQGREILIEASQLLEVLPAMPVSPLPGPVPGIAGVILYQGEFLPVFDWRALDGHAAPSAPKALGVLRRRFALPLDELAGTVDSGNSASRIESSAEDPWADILACRYTLEGSALPLLDSDKLIAWLHQRRGKR